MTKIILSTIVGTVVAWFLVSKFMSSTNHMPATFSIDHSAQIERKEAKKKIDAQAAKLAKAQSEQLLSASSIPASQKIAGANVDGPASLANNNGANSSIASRLTVEETGLTVQSQQLANVRTADAVLGPLNNVRRLPADESGAVVDEDAAPAETVDGELIGSNNEEASEAERQDSDADMQERGASEDNEPVNSADNEIRTRNEIASTRSTVTQKKKVETVTALNIAYALPTTTGCTAPSESYPQVGVSYRPDSFAIKGQSLSNIDQLIRLHKKCNGGKFIVLNNVTDEIDVDDRLIGLRQDEVKYYLLQRRIPKDDIIFSDKL